MNIKNSGLSAGQSSASQKKTFTADESDISVIKFEGAKVRVVNINGEPWFIVADVCKALAISNPSDAVSALDEDEVMTLALTDGHYGKRGGARKWNVISEYGFYKLVARSRSATTPDTFAHRFTNWVFREVIPSIRKTGAYGVPFASLNDYSKRRQQYAITASKRGKELESCKKEKAALNTEEAELWRKHQPDFLEDLQ